MAVSIDMRYVARRIGHAFPASGMYGWVIPTPRSSIAIRTLLSGMPQKTHPSDWHSTVLYSKSGAYPVEETPLKLPDRITAHITDFAFFGPDDDIVCAAVLESPDLVSIHDQLIGMGYTHGWDTYEPHMTVADKFIVTPEFRVWMDHIKTHVNHLRPAIEFLPGVWFAPVES